MKIPDFIKSLINENEGFNWVEDHDKLEVFTKSPYNIQNQIDWWRKNVDIRNALKIIETEIRELKKNKKKISKKFVSWSKIADLARCDRNTLKHPKRIKWVQERIDFLVELMKNNKVTLISVQNGVIDPEQKIIELEEQVVKARNESFKWYDKCTIMEKEYKMLLRLLKNKDNEIFVRDRKIKELYEKLRID